MSLYNIYLVLGPLCKPLLVMELPNKRLLLLLITLLKFSLKTGLFLCCLIKHRGFLLEIRFSPFTKREGPSRYPSGIRGEGRGGGVKAVR